MLPLTLSVAPISVLFSSWNVMNDYGFTGIVISTSVQTQAREPTHAHTHDDKAEVSLDVSETERLR